LYRVQIIIDQNTGTQNEIDFRVDRMLTHSPAESGTGQQTVQSRDFLMMMMVLKWISVFCFVTWFDLAHGWF
jgi:prophage tail gpP-like protein